MRKIINSTYITLDGIIEGPHLWPKLSAPTDERAGAMQIELLNGCDAVLMGRRTYDVMAAAWPQRSGDSLSSTMNSIQKYVVSSSLRNPDWANTSVIRGAVVEEIKKLKEADGKDIVQYGFGSVSKLMIEHGLLDELRLWLYPQTIGNGKLADLLAVNATRAQFRFVGSTALNNGIVILRYELTHE